MLVLAILLTYVQVILNKRIPVKYLKEIKNVLIGALASNGQSSEALEMYEEMKGAKCDLDPKAIKSLIVSQFCLFGYQQKYFDESSELNASQLFQEHFESEGLLNKSLELLEELNDSPYWTDACFRVISHCVRHENLRSSFIHCWSSYKFFHVNFRDYSSFVCLDLLLIYSSK